MRLRNCQVCVSSFVRCTYSEYNCNSIYFRSNTCQRVWLIPRNHAHSIPSMKSFSHSHRSIAFPTHLYRSFAGKINSKCIRLGINRWFLATTPGIFGISLLSSEHTHRILLASNIVSLVSTAGENTPCRSRDFHLIHGLISQGSSQKYWLTHRYPRISC